MEQKLCWHRLETERDNANTNDKPCSQAEPSGKWKTLLCGQGSPTQHIRAATGGRLGIDLIDMSIASSDGSEPPLVCQLPAPHLLRQVWGLSPEGERLFYAASWWEAARAGTFLSQPTKPIWENLSAIRPALQRQITAVYRGNCAALEKGFGMKGPFWGRDYGFWHGETLIAVIYEVFSPALARHWEIKGAPVSGLQP
jgi:chorismate lyase